MLQIVIAIVLIVFFGLFVMLSFPIEAPEQDALDQTNHNTID